MTETISVVFQPVEGTGGTAYHETLVYTNSSGQSYFCSSGPTNPIAQGDWVKGLEAWALEGDAQADMACITPSFLGTLTASGTTDVFFDPSVAGGPTRDDDGNPYPSVVIATGSSLGSQWSTIASTYSSVSSEDLTYSMLQQNSNSLASTALTEAGLSLPATSVQVYSTQAGDYWVPGQDRSLPVPSSFDQLSLDSSSTDGSGNTTTTYDVKDAEGDLLETMTAYVDAAGDLADLSLSVGATTYFTQEATVSGASETPLPVVKDDLAN
jgi:hypothetical protein